MPQFDSHWEAQAQRNASNERAAAASALSEVRIPQELRHNMELFLRLTRRVLKEYDSKLCSSFDLLLEYMVHANDEDISETDKDEAYTQAVRLIDKLTLEEEQYLTRAFATYFHLANIAEEDYRVSSLRRRERVVPTDSAEDPVNEITVSYHRLIEEVGKDEADSFLNRLEFHPVFTAHPTEARRKAVTAKIRLIADLLAERPSLGGTELAENERRMLQEIDSLFRTSPIAAKKPTPVEEADTIIDIFDSTLFEMVPKVYRRFDDWELGSKAGTVKPVCPAFFRLGSWIGSDRDGNPNVTAKVSRKVAEKFRVHMLTKLADATEYVGRALTMEGGSTKPSAALQNLWSHQLEMNEELCNRVMLISVSELHRAVMLVMAERLRATIARTADLMYADADEFLGDLRVVQDSLVEAGAVREAYGLLQTLIWQTETFGFNMVQMEFRQHSVVHSRALADLKEHGRTGQLQPMTREVVDTFRAIGAIQRKNGVEAARRYIISFTKSAQNVADVYELARLSFAHEKDVPTLDVIPLFEQVEDLENAVTTLSQIIGLPDVKKRLAQTNRRLEVMLGYSDSSKDAGPTSATLVLHKAQKEIADWAQANNIDLVLMHGRGGAVGRGGGPANHAVLAQPRGSVNCCFKLTEQGEVIFARYGNPVLARRHVESVAAATLMHSSPEIGKINTTYTEKYHDMAAELEKESRGTYLKLLNQDGFAEWFSCVTPLAEIGLLPIGSRPAKRGLGAKSLDDLRTIPWIFSWSQARINLAAWYGLGSACEAFGDLDALRHAYAEWPLFQTFIDNIEMSLAKTDERIAWMYMGLGNRPELSEMVMDELALTKKWVFAILNEDEPLQHRRVLGPVVRARLPFVNALSIIQMKALDRLRREDESEKLTPEEKERFIFLILCTVSGVAAGLQNTG